MNIKRLDDPTVPAASTLVGLILYGMQGGQTVKVTPTLLEGSDGVDGVNGKSAYQVAVDNGFVGTQAQWLDSLIGNSAYEEWVANGGAGTFQDFLDEIVETVNLLIPQTLTEAQKAQVRENIDALASSVINEELGKKADHGYTAEETPKTLKQVDDSVSQLAGDVLSREALHLSSIFARPTLTERSRITKDGIYQTGNITTYTTGFIPIQEGADVFVLGIITTDATPVAFYGTNAQDSFIQAELNNNYAHYSSEELSAMGAKYLRCTISLKQVESGDWFVIASNIEKSVDDIITDYVNNAYRNDVKTEELLDGGSLNRNGGRSLDSNYRTTYLEIKEGCGIAVKAWGSEISFIPVICFYSDASLDSFITCFYNDDEFTISYNELVAIGAKYFRCSINAEQIENGDWYIQYLSVKEIEDSVKEIEDSVKEIEDSVKNTVSFLPQELNLSQKVQAKNNIDAADKYFGQLINLSVLTISHNTINSDSNWYSSSNYNSVFVPITPGEYYHVHADLATVVAILTSNVSSTSDPVTTFATGFEERIMVTENNNYSFICPEDGQYLYVLTKGNSGELNPSVYKNIEINDFLERVTEEIDTIKENDDTLYNEVSSKRRIADSIGNSLTPLSIPVDESGYEIPTTIEVLNVQKKAKQMTNIVWTPINDISYRLGGDTPEESVIFPSGVSVTGLPYSSVKEIDKYIGFDVSIHTFMTAVNNPYSLIYTEIILGTASKSDWGKIYHGVNCATYYGTVCSVLSGYATGQVVQWPTAEDKWCASINFNMVKLFNQNAQGLRIGDIYWKNGHNRLIVGLKRDANGNVTHVQVTESTGRYVRQNADITAEQFNTKMVDENGIIYRNIELYKNEYVPSEFVAVMGETITPYDYNDDICCFAGDKATFRESDLIVLNYNLKNVGSWTGIKVFKDDVLVDTYTLANIDQSTLPEGQKNHALSLGNIHSYGKYKACMTDGTNDSDYTYWEVLQTDVAFDMNSDDVCHIAWDSANANPLSFTICNQVGVVYAHNELAVEDVENGYLDINLIKFNRQQYPDRPFVSGMYLKVHFEGEYGRVTNEPLSVQLT